jgi:deoxyribonuclease V
VLPPEIIESQRARFGLLSLAASEGASYQWVYAVDVAYSDQGAYAAAVLVENLDFGQKQAVRAQALHHEALTVSYQPGLFAQREAALIMAVVAKLQAQSGQAADLLLVDGHGTAHPGRFGLACQVGLELALPTIGCAKQPLLPTPVTVGAARGDKAYYWDTGLCLGCALRTQTNVKPVYVSPGQLIDVETAAALILQLSQPYRQPEPLRAAHLAAIGARAAGVV